MTTFPSLAPSSRVFTPGRHPHSTINVLNGLQTRVRTSNVILNQTISLSFTALTEAQMLSIRNHYTSQQGRFIPFDIPATLLSGMTTPASFTPTNYSWIYSEPPRVEDIGLQRYTVSVTLVAIPPEVTKVAGEEFTVSVLLVAGVGSASVDAAGASLTVTISIQGGIVADNTSAGFNLNVAILLTAAEPIYTAPSFVSASGTSFNSGGFTINIIWPTHQANDIGLLAVETGGTDPNLGGSFLSTWNAIPGSPVTDVASSAGSKLHLYWTRATSSSMGSINVSTTSGDHLVGRFTVWRDCFVYGNPWDVIATGTKTIDSTTATLPAVTTTQSATRVVMVAGRPDDSSITNHFGVPVNANLTGLIKHAEGGTISGTGGGFVFASGVMQAAGDTGTSTMTKAVSTTDTYYTIALRSRPEAGSAYVPGAALSISASIQGGVSADNALAGFNLTRLISLIPGVPPDSDADTYIAAVEAADGQTLEPAVISAITGFVRGCKADGTWTAIKASCILAGARTLAGALVPLVGPAPTNSGTTPFAAGNYDRKLGLLGTSSINGRYLNSNRADNVSPQDSNHIAVYCTQAATTQAVAIGAGTTGTITWLQTGSNFSIAPRNRTATNLGGLGAVGLTGFAGTNRSNSTQIVARVNGANSTLASTSAAPQAFNVFIFATSQGTAPGTPTSWSNVKLTFYSIGESVDLALLDTRVTALMNAFTAVA